MVAERNQLFRSPSFRNVTYGAFMLVVMILATCAQETNDFISSDPAASAVDSALGEADVGFPSPARLDEISFLRQPTSAPTMFFEAPSVPSDAFEDEYLNGDSPEQPIIDESEPAKPEEQPPQDITPLQPEPVQPKDVPPTYSQEPGTVYSPAQQVGSTDQFAGTRIESNTGAVDIKQEIEAENRTAINSATYIFYTFVLVIFCILTAYFYKKAVGGNMGPLGIPDPHQQYHRYMPVEHHDPEEFFSRRNIEMAHSRQG